MHIYRNIACDNTDLKNVFDGDNMEIDIVFKIAAVGILVAVLNQVLVRAGREEQAMMTTLAGLVVVLFWVVQYISSLFDTVQTIFRL
jgi:stage III sporulation protein AC